MLPGILVAVLCHFLSGGKAEDGESFFSSLNHIQAEPARSEYHSYDDSWTPHWDGNRVWFLVVEFLFLFFIAQQQSAHNTARLTD